MGLVAKQVEDSLSVAMRDQKVTKRSFQSIESPPDHGKRG
jgi:hypothetical protein